MGHPGRNPAPRGAVFVFRVEGMAIEGSTPSVRLLTGGVTTIAAPGAPEGPRRG